MRVKYAILGVAVGIVGLWALANQAPRAQTTVIYAEPNKAVEVTLIAEDPDGDPLEFELLDLPFVGTLVGAASHFTYHPAPDFVGAVRVTFRARDPHGAFDIGWVEIRVSKDVQALRILPQKPLNETLLKFAGFLLDRGVRTWYIADLEPRSFPCGLLPFFFVGGERAAQVLLVGPAEAPRMQDLGELRDHVLWVDMRQAQPGLYFFLVLNGENAFTYPVRLVQPMPDRKLAYAG